MRKLENSELERKSIEDFKQKNTADLVLDDIRVCIILALFLELPTLF
jgi:hypothetical protein